MSFSMANKTYNDKTLKDIVESEKKLLEIKKQLKEAKKKLDDMMGVNVNVDVNSIIIYKGINDK